MKYKHNNIVAGVGGLRTARTYPYANARVNDVLVVKRSGWFTELAVNRNRKRPIETFRADDPALSKSNFKTPCQAPGAKALSPGSYFLGERPEGSS